MSLVGMSPSACKRGQTPAREEGPAWFFLLQVGFMMMVMAMTGGSRSTALGGGRRRERGCLGTARLDGGRQATRHSGSALARAQLSREVSASKEMMAASDKVTSCSRLSVSWWSRRAVELRRAFSAGSATEGAAAGGKMTSMSSFLLTRGPFRSRSATSVGVASVTVAVTCVSHCPLTQCGACRALLRSGDNRCCTGIWWRRQRCSGPWCSSVFIRHVQSL